MTTGPAGDLQQQLTALLPNLRAFARSLSGNVDSADDLVQETLVKAWRSRDSFTSGTNLKAWLFAILRNTYISDIRKRKREVPDPDGLLAGQLAVKGSQEGHVDMQDFVTALAQLPQDQKEALLLVGAEGFSYEEVALMCGCAVGTIKSRVNRARNRLCEVMGIEGASAFGVERQSRVHGTHRA